MTQPSLSLRSRSLAKFGSVAVAAAFAFLAPCAFAQTETWDGGGGDDNFGTGANWADDSAPTTGSSVVLNFGGGTRPTPINNYTSGNDFGEWHLLNTATTDFTITGNGFGLYTKIENDTGSGRTFTINTAGIYARDSSIELNPVGGNMVIGAAIELDGNATLNVYDGSNGRTLTLNGALSNGNGTGGNGQIILNQTATVVLAADSDYGGTTLSSGTKLYVGTGGTTGSLGVGNTANAGALYFNRSNAYTYAGIISGAGTVTQQGSGTLTLTGANSFSGGLTINAGAVTVSGTAGQPGTGSVAIDAGTTFEWNTGAGSRTISTVNSFSGTGTFLKSGANNLVLQGTNASTFSGTVRVAGGLLILDSAANFENGVPALDLAGGDIVLGNAFDGGTATFGNLSGSGQVRVDYGTGSVTRTISINQTGTTTYSGVMGYYGSSTRTLSLVKNGTGTLTLSGANTYIGATTVNSGTLKVSNTMRNTSGMTVNSGATLELGATNMFTSGHGVAMDNSRVLTANGGTLLMNGSMDSRIGNVTLTNGGTWTSNRALTNYDVLLANTSTGAATVTVSGSGAATMNGTGGIHLQGVQNFDVADVTGDSGADLTVSMILASQGSAEGAAGGINKTGAGTMLLSGANTFTGNVAVNAGVIKIGNKNALGAFATGRPVTQVTVASGAAVDFNGTPDATYGYTIAGTGVGGTGALTNTGAAIGTGSAQASNIKLSADASIGGTGNWALLTNEYGATSLDLNGKTLTKVGSNTIYLCNTTISNGGTIQVSQGTLGTFRDGSVGSTTALILDNTVGVGLNLGANLVIGSLSGGGAAGGNVTSSATLTVGGLDTSTTYAGVISGTGALTKTGTGTLALTGANTYGGNTTINGGTLDLTAGRLYSAGYQSTAIVTVAGGTLLLNSFAYDLAAASLGGLRDYASARVINGGTIEVVGGTHSSGNDFTVGTNGGTFRYNPANTANTLTLSGNGNSNIPIAGALTFQADGNITVSEVIEGAGSLTKTGAGTLTLSNAANSFTGNVTINAGQVTAIGASGNTNTALGAASGSRTITVNSTGTLMLSGNNVFGGSTQTLANTPKVVVAGGTLTTNAYNVIGNIDLNGGTLTATAGGSAGYQTYEFNGSTITVGGTSASTISSSASSNGGMHIAGTKTLTLNVGDVVSGTDLTVSAALIDGSSDRLGAGSLLKSGTGTLLLSGINTYTGGTTVNGGTLRLTASSGGTGTIRGTLTANAGTTIEIGGSDVLGYGGGANAVNTINLDGATLVQTQNRNETSTAVINMAGGSTISATGGASALFDMYGGTAAINSSGDLTNTISSPIRFRQDSTTFTVADGAAATDLLVSGSISENELAEYRHTALVKDGAGTMVLSGAGSYTGNTTIKAGTLALSGSGSIATSPVITVGDAGSSGTVLDVSGLTSGTNTGDWTLGSGQTLKGIGDVTTASTGTITIAGTHSPGNSAAIQQINGSTTYASTSIFVWELYANTTSNSPTVYYDQVNITGTLKIDDGAAFNVVLNDTGSSVDLENAFWQAPRQWQVFSYTGSLTYTNGFTLGTVSSAQTPVSDYGSFSFTYDPSKKVYLNWTPVPELSNLLVGGVLAVGLLRRRRAPVAPNVEC